MVARYSVCREQGDKRKAAPFAPMLSQIRNRRPLQICSLRQRETSSFCGLVQLPSRVRSYGPVCLQVRPVSPAQLSQPRTTHRPSHANPRKFHRLRQGCAGASTTSTQRANSRHPPPFRETPQRARAAPPAPARLTGRHRSRRVPAGDREGCPWTTRARLRAARVRRVDRP